MIIFALDNDNSEYRKLLNQIEEFATLETFDDYEFLLETIRDEECHGIILNYDQGPRKSEKNIKSLKKLKKDIPLFIFSNELDSKKIIKHQKSKTGASLYIQTPIDTEMLFMMVEPFWKGEEALALRAEDKEIINTHGQEASNDFSEASEVVNQDIDGALAAVFPEEYLVDEKNSESDIDQQDEQLEPLAEISLDLDDEEVDEANFPNEHDLTFPELDISEVDLGEADEEDIPELTLGDNEASDLTLSNEEQESDFDLELNLGDNENADLDLELNLDDNEGSDLILNDEDEDEDAGLDIELNLDVNNTPELNLEDDGDGANDLDLSFADDNDEDLNLNLSEDADDDVEEESTAELPANLDDFSLNLSDDSEDYEENILDDNEIDDISSLIEPDGDLDNFLVSSEEVDDELTRPALDTEMLDLDNQESTKTSTSTSVENVDDELDLNEVEIENNFDSTIMGLNISDNLSNTEVEAEDEPEEQIEDEVEDLSSNFDEDMTQIFTPDLDTKEELNTSRVSHVGAETKTTIESKTSAQEHRSYVQSHDDELVRLGETINSLRSDREALLDKISKIENRDSQEKEDLLNLKAQLDEKSIELVVVKKRLEKKSEELQVQLDISFDKRAFLEKKNQNFALEIERLSKDKRLDNSRVHQRERELEEKLEMLRKDSEIQLRNRDQKILELKRRIDSLEFDIESLRSKERNSVTEQVDLEDKMDSVIKTLRTAIGQLEEDHIAQEKRLKIKKNLKI